MGPPQLDVPRSTFYRWYRQYQEEGPDGLRDQKRGSEQIQEFDTWLQKCEASQIPELLNYASGMQKDFAAIQTVISPSWSNGQIEGLVNRLKLLKKQMYGRANFNLGEKGCSADLLHQVGHEICGRTGTLPEAALP